MPELPEVETVRRQNAPFLEGRRIVSAWADVPRITRPDVDTFARALAGRRVQACCRRGKQMYFPLDDGRVLLIHLGMTGRLLVADSDVTGRHVHAVLKLDSGRRIVFEDPRTFGNVGVADDLGFLERYGPEPLDDGFDAAALVAVLRARRCAVKSALLDQRVVAGIGNIYADEICHLAGVHPARTAAQISAQRLGRVVAHMRPVLDRALAAAGATVSPTSRYQDVFGESGDYVPHVYGRTGQPCAKCGSAIRRGVLGRGKSARSYHFCPRCQR